MLSRKLVWAALIFGTVAGASVAEAGDVRVLSLGQNERDAFGKKLTDGLRDALRKKGYTLESDAPEPAVLQELKTRSLATGESLDEAKGLISGSETFIVGGWEAKGDDVIVRARLVDAGSGAVLDTAEVTGDEGDAEKIASQLADKLAGAIGKPVAATAKDELVEVQVVGMGPMERVALTVAKRDAVEQAVGAVVDVKKVPDMKTVKASAQSSLSYRIVKKEQEGRIHRVTIAAKVLVPAEIARRYPAPAKLVSEETGFKPYVERSAKGEVDWEKGILRVVGRAKVAAGADAKTQLNARRAAVADAYARAMEVVSGVRISGDEKIADAEKADATLSVRIKGLVQGGKVVAENATAPGGNYEVTLEVPMRGLRGVQTTLLDRLGTPKETVETAEMSNVSDQEAEFTGILIDARGTGLQAGLFPRILDADGNVIADPGESDPTVLAERGQAAYVVSEPGDQGWMHERLGPNPVMFRAEVLGGEPYDVAGLEPMVLAQNAPRIRKISSGNLRQGKKPMQIKGVKTNGRTQVNLLVSTTQANKAQFKSNLKNLFGKCKVVVVMDSQIGGTEGRLVPATLVLTEMAAR